MCLIGLGFNYCTVLTTACAWLRQHEIRGQIMIDRI